MNIVLINPYAENRTFCPPLGILYLAGILRKSGYDISIFDMDVDKVTDDELLNHIREAQPLFVGITCNAVQIVEVFRLAELLSRLGVPVIVGDEKIIKNLRKGLKLADVVRARKLCSQAGILFRSFFMIGCIGETYMTTFDTIGFAQRLGNFDEQSYSTQGFRNADFSR